MNTRVMIGRHFVGAWRWDREMTREPFAGIAGVYSKMSGLIATATDRANAIRRDPDLSEKGRANSLRKMVESEVAPQIKSAADALGRSREWITTKRASLAPAKPDPTDLAGALMRQELRAYFRALEPSTRTAAIIAGNVDPQMAQAILEAPAFLSGTTDEQRKRLVETAALAAHPDAALEMGEVEEAIEVASNAFRAAVKTVEETTGLPKSEVDALLGNGRASPWDFIASLMAPHEDKDGD